MIENTYGFKKRLVFISSVIEKYQPKHILDIGCGTGANLTLPLAQRFPDTFFIGIDNHSLSVDYANTVNTARNLKFFSDVSLAHTQTFDLVIASEVLEHVENPYPFLEFILSHLSVHGKLVLTVPNGFGPFEFGSLLENLLQLTGIYKLLLKVKSIMVSSASNNPANNKLEHDTLANSPHINFFAFGQLCSILKYAGFRILVFRPRTFMCGFVFDQLIKSQFAIDLNAKISDYLPAQLASSWMFLLEPFKVGIQKPQNYSRSTYSRVRKYISMKRWSLL